MAEVPCDRLLTGKCTWCHAERAVPCPYREAERVPIEIDIGFWNDGEILATELHVSLGEALKVYAASNPSTPPVFDIKPGGNGYDASEEAYAWLTGYRMETPEDVAARLDQAAKTRREFLARQVAEAQARVREAEIYLARIRKEQK